MEALERLLLPCPLALEGLRRSAHLNRELPVIETEPRPPVRAIVASFLFTDLVDFSKGAASEQYVAKAALAACLRSNLAALRETDYWIKDTGDGALIAFVSNPEHALYMALAIAQDYAQAADGSEGPSHSLRTGLHLGTVKETIDVEARRNYIGDGINATKRIMDFAAPGQIAASRNFFEAVANLDTEYAALFRHVGAPDDKHGRAHELYAVAPSAEVLKKLRLDLTAATPRLPESDGKSAPAIAVRRDTLAEVSTGSRLPSKRTAEAVRTGFNPLIWLIALVALAAAIFWIMRSLWQAAPTVEPVSSQSVPVPMSATVPDASPTVIGEPAAHSPASSVITAKPDKAAAVGATHATKDAASNGGAPPVVAPATAPNVNVDSTPRIPGSPAAPVRVPSAPDRDSTRCSRIVEKAALGEPLSQDEKKELANSCR
jgi:class 3 adenylate cyclase